MEVKDFILASGSPQRKALLAQIGFNPKQIIPADIDESCLKYERPLPYVRRMAEEKAQKVWQEHKGEVVLACDTVVTVGLRIIHKSKNPEEQEKVIRLLSGRNHKVISAVCVIDKNGKMSSRCVTTRISMKKLSEKEIREYIDSKEWQGVCGYKVEGMLAGYVKNMVGSFSGVVGLPLYETKNLLTGAGVK